MHEIQRLLIALNLAGALIQGWNHQPAWLLVPLLAFAAYVLAEDRALRRQIGPRAWPSEGFARFNFNTNLYFALKHLLLGALLFLVAGMASGLAVS